LLYFVCVVGRGGISKFCSGCAPPRPPNVASASHNRKQSRIENNELKEEEESIQETRRNSR
jgi:hypothetical protein